MPAGKATSTRRAWSSNAKDPVARQVYLLLQHVSGELVHELSTLLKPWGITPEQYHVLRILSDVGSAGTPLTSIGERSPAGDPDITRLIDRLEQRGLARRERDSADRRVVTASITSEGRRLHGRLEKPVAALHERQLQALGNQSMADLKRLLRKVVEAGPI